MKISISWVFDHIEADWKKIDIAKLAEQFIQTTSEIDRVHKVTFDARHFALGKIIRVSDQITVSVPDLKKEFNLPHRPDVQENSWFVMAIKPEVRWATLADLGSAKEGLLCAMNESAKLSDIESLDYIFELDNKSINHRPDLWGHRGVAREIAAMLGFKLKPLDQFLAPLEIIQYGETASATSDQPYAIKIQNSKKCSRFGACFVPSVEHRPSDLMMAVRLARVDARPINAIVDATNYTMFDIGHPMHAFDAAALGGKSIEIRDAKKGEKLQLLDGTELNLTTDDLVIATEDGPKALAGIMGGLASGVHHQTTSLLIEAACFDATMIRKTAERAKLRTEASARFEKSLDPNNNVNALRRFAQLLKNLKVPHTIGATISSLGKPAESPVLVVEHAYIESRLGVSLESSQVVELLKRVDLGAKQIDEKGHVAYEIIVPTYRATKDIQGKQDIVEEVGRLFGYNNIVPELPMLQLKPANLHLFDQEKKIKDTLAFGGKMREVANYNFFDQSFIQFLGWDPGATLEVRSPVSQNWQRLVTTLMPNLIKGIHENCADYDQLRFFELARIYIPGKEISELKRLAGILFEKKKDLSFYEGKAVLHDLFERISLPVTWHKLGDVKNPWEMLYQTAEIKHGNQVIGVAGMMAPQFLHKMSEGTAFIFELDADFLLSYQAPTQRFAELPKFQPNVRDVSLFIPTSRTVAELTTCIERVDSRIHDVHLIDFMEKKEWGNKRAVTLRFTIQQNEKTLTKSEIDAIVQSVANAVIAHGAEIR